MINTGLPLLNLPLNELVTACKGMLPFGATPASVMTADDELETSVGGGVALRGSFLIDEHGNVRHEIKNDLPLGRNVDEMLRLLDALDHHNKHGEVCPAGWMKGKTGMHPSDEGMKDYLANNTEEL